jgi:hypothetical protein
MGIQGSLESLHPWYVDPPFAETAIADAFFIVDNLPLAKGIAASTGGSE